jgi:[CysO sulfur-carrier protein]-thiocarboxylate-dependent cysteine synthase
LRITSILDTVGNTPLVQLPNLSPSEDVRFFAKLEGQNPTGSVKDRIAKYMLEDAERKGELTPGRVILEATSGNTGIALAFIGRLKGYRVKAVMPDNVSKERAQLRKAFGAELVYTDGRYGTNGAIDMAQEMMRADPDAYYMPYQFGNVANPRAHYETTGPEILRDLPEVDVFVAGLGTGGTLTGAGRYLKERRPEVKVIATVPHPGDLVQGLRSLEDGFIPEVFDESVLDGKIVVTSRTAFAAAKELTQKEGIFAGISSGAVLRTAQRVARRLKEGNVVLLLADGGWKYLSTELWTKEYEDLPEDIESMIWW